MGCLDLRGSCSYLRRVGGTNVSLLDRRDVTGPIHYSVISRERLSLIPGIHAGPSVIDVVGLVAAIGV